MNLAPFKSRTLAVYGLLAILMCIVEVFDMTSIRYIVKPLLCITLIYYVYQFKQDTIQKHEKNINIVMLALIFSLAGDVFLIFPQFFIVGLCAFLIAHLSYIVAFYQDMHLKYRIKNKFIQLIIILVFVYVIIFYLSVQYKLLDLKIPVIMYMIVISIMFITTLLRQVKAGYLLVIFGAFFFLMSDSILAICRYLHYFHGGNLAIIITYMVAQFLIVTGCAFSYSSIETK